MPGTGASTAIATAPAGNASISCRTAGISRNTLRFTVSGMCTASIVTTMTTGVTTVTTAATTIVTMTTVAAAVTTMVTVVAVTGMTEA